MSPRVPNYGGDAGWDQSRSMGERQWNSQQQVPQFREPQARIDHLGPGVAMKQWDAGYEKDLRGKAGANYRGNEQDHFKNGMVGDGNYAAARGRARQSGVNNAAVDHLSGAGGQVQNGGDWESQAVHKKKSVPGAGRDHLQGGNEVKSNVHTGPRGRKIVYSQAGIDHINDAANVAEGQSQWENMRGKGGMHARPSNNLGNGVALVPSGPDQWLDKKVRNSNDFGRKDHFHGAAAIQVDDDNVHARGLRMLDNKAAAKDHLGGGAAAVTDSSGESRPQRQYHNRPDHFAAGGGGVINNGTDQFLAYRPGKIYNPKNNIDHLNAGLEVSEAELKPQYPNRRYGANKNGAGKLMKGLMVAEDPFNPHVSPRKGFNNNNDNRVIGKPPAHGTVRDWGSEMAQNFGRDGNVVHENAKKNSVIKNPDHGQYETMYGGLYGRDKEVIEQKFAPKPENNNRFETAYGGRYGRDSSVVADKFDKMKDKTMPYTSMYGGIHGRDPDVFYNNRQKKQLLM